MAEERESRRVDRYTWRCPYCSSSHSYLDGKQNAYDKAKNAMLNHIRMSDDPAHGLKSEYPPCFDPETVDSCIEFERITT